MPAYLRGMVPTGLAVPVLEKATELFDLQLSREAVDDASRHVRQVLQKGAEKTRGAELDGKAQRL